MFWKYPINFSRTAAFHLTLFYFVIFSLVLIASTSMIYFSIQKHLAKEVDSLLFQIKEKMMHYIEGDLLEILQDEFNREAEARGTFRIFIRLITLDGDRIVSSNLTQWPKIPAPFQDQHRSLGKEYLVTRNMNHNSTSIRILSAPVSDQQIFQTGIVLNEQYQFLNTLYREAAIMILFAMPLVALLGYGAARYALKGVEAVSRTAERITQGEFERRVDCHLHGEEFAQLGKSFNEMADHIQSIMSEMRDVNDLIAHDLRSPLTRIRMAAESLVEKPNNISEVMEAAGFIVHSSDSLLRMINTMLEISETNTRIRTLNRMPIDLKSLLEKAVDLYTPLAEEKQIEFRCSVAESLFVNGEEGKLQRALANLLDNATKFSPKGGIIEIRLSSIHERVLISILDEGPGIQPKDQAKIFERFYRADRSRHLPGNGLGLCLTKAIVEAHGGLISVDSSPNKKTCFTIELPQS